ncbi:hypothetical protein ACQP3D_28040, partial [Escherichia coli]
GRETASFSQASFSKALALRQLEFSLVADVLCIYEIQLISLNMTQADECPEGSADRTDKQGLC